MKKHLVILGGPNGAGKTSTARVLLPQFLKIDEFVNADNIAAGLSPFNPEGQAVTAGRLMLKRIDTLSEAGENFAFESTLASTVFVRRIKKAQEEGYEVSLLYFWLNTVELAIRRVRKRVQQGGHDIPKKDIRRRYKRSIYNLLNLYLPVVNYAEIYDNSGNLPKLIAIKENKSLDIKSGEVFTLLEKAAG